MKSLLTALALLAFGATVQVKTGSLALLQVQHCTLDIPTAEISRVD